jgi:hypothetical protein
MGTKDMDAPIFNISFPDGGPGCAEGDPDPIEEFRRKYGCEPPPPRFTITFDTPNEKETES